MSENVKIYYKDLKPKYQEILIGLTKKDTNDVTSNKVPVYDIKKENVYMIEHELK